MNPMRSADPTQAETDAVAGGRGLRARAVCTRCAVARCSNRSNLGAIVRRLRLEAGFGTRRFAARALCDRSTVRRLEAGAFRPRPSLLGLVANAVDPDRRDEIRALLVAAAGGCVAADTPGTARWRGRLAARALLDGTLPLPTRIARGRQLHPMADAAWRHAMDLADQALTYPNNDPRQARLLRETLRAMDESRALREAAGPPFVLWVSGLRKTYKFSYGYRCP